MPDDAAFGPARPAAGAAPVRAGFGTVAPPPIPGPGRASASESSPTTPARRGATHRRTPCVGVCSTTYGDLVCRGCKRFAHEIVGWNGYQEQQRRLVWSRLQDLLGQSVRAHLTVLDPPRLRAAAAAAGIGAAETPAEALAVALLRVPETVPAAVGLAARDAANAGRRSLLDAIDREFYARSRAWYEASFKTLT